ncbi:MULTISPECIES: YidC/Oxa1 family membrane protein insertase [unclassified Streptomyces]|uniref:YidC/Oxa1 family membrane protein insertase n=1 Tax=unclassified Streptomyces TaxID=2593676 RepID=UPI0037F2E939
MSTSLSALSPLPAFVQLVEALADLLAPLFATSATAAAIVLFTAFVRLLVHPLSRASVRGQRARAALAPRIAELRRRHGRDPERFKRALLDLHTREKVSPLSGILPSLLQAPAFLVLYYVFSHTTVGGEPNGLLAHRLFDAPLGDRWADAVASGGVFGGAGMVYLGLFAVVAAVATYSYRWSRRAAATASGGLGGGGSAVSAEGEVPGVRAVLKVMPFLSFFTLITVAVVPLAAALYVVTSTAWGVVERAALMRHAPLGAEGETVRSSPRS